MACHHSEIFPRDILCWTSSNGSACRCQHVAVMACHHSEIFPGDILCQTSTIISMWLSACCCDGMSPFRDLLQGCSLSDIIKWVSMLLSAHRCDGMSPFRDLPWGHSLLDQGLFPSLGPSPIDPHAGCGPRLIKLHFWSHLFGASDVAALRCFVLQPCWLTLGLTD